MTAGSSRKAERRGEGISWELLEHKACRMEEAGRGKAGASKSGKIIPPSEVFAGTSCSGPC